MTLACLCSDFGVKILWTLPVAALNGALTRVETKDVDMHVTADEGRVERNNCVLSNYPFQTLCSRYNFIFQPHFFAIGS